jgi:glycosyltransferase involved in cell wall biosynthesis
MDKVGIYMPAYNSGKYIEESMNSIFDQTHHNWELVIVDDHSDDNTYNIASRKANNTRLYKPENDEVYGVKDEIPPEDSMTYTCYKPNVKLLKRGKHAGKIGVVKNEAIAELSDDCDFICHVGSDDMITKDCLEVFVKFMNDNPDIGAACGNFECFDNMGKKWSYPHVTKSGEFNPDVMLNYMCMFPMRFYRKETIEAVGGYSNELSSAVDYDLALKISEKFKIKRLKDPITYMYRRHKEQASTKGKSEQDMNAKKALENALKRRNIKMEVVNDLPPFQLKQKKEKVHKIWGK